MIRFLLMHPLLTQVQKDPNDSDIQWTSELTQPIFFFFVQWRGTS